MKLPGLLAVCLTALAVRSNEPPRLFVDGQLAQPSCQAYDPASRRCGGGAARAFRTLAAAAAAATDPGTSVFIREGTYQEALVPRASGSSGQPITYGAYRDEAVILSGQLDPAIDLSDRSHIVIEGLTVRRTVGWLRAANSRFLVIRRCRFAEASAQGSRGGLKFVGAHDNQIRQNVIDGGHDNLLLINSDRNIVERNIIANGRHAVWSVLCGSDNVIKENQFINTLQKIGQISDCDGKTTDVPRRENATRRNVVQANLFFYTPPAKDAAPFAGLQYGGQAGIIRGNAFVGTSGPALQMTLYADESRFTTGNRIYHNVFLRTAYAAIELPGDTSFAFEDNIFKNNILYASVFAARDRRWAWFTRELNGKPVQVLSGRLKGFLMERNVIFGTAPGQAYVVAYGSPTNASQPPPHTLAWWQQQPASPFVKNIDIRPVFRDERRYDVRLAAESVLVDAGAFLTRAAGSGTGEALRVEDAAYFSDGFGVAGVVGDEVQLEGDERTARVVSADAAARVLKLDRPLSWRRGQGVSLKYLGKAPDLGLPDGYEPPRQPPKSPR